MAWESGYTQEWWDWHGEQDRQEDRQQAHNLPNAGSNPAPAPSADPCDYSYIHDEAYRDLEYEL